MRDFLDDEQIIVIVNNQEEGREVEIQLWTGRHQLSGRYKAETYCHEHLQWDLRKNVKNTQQQPEF